MSITAPIRKRIQALKKEYDALRKGKESLLIMIDEAEISESVYNSNAIENSTLTLKETEKILLDMEVSRDFSLREVFEAKNLARVTEYMRNKVEQQGLTKEFILLLHQMLITNINDSIAGRFREKGEYVRVGSYIAPAPEHVESMIEDILSQYSGDLESHIVDKIAKFHLDFEGVHPFIDGNGRMGRVIMNYQLLRSGFPVIIIRNKEKKYYYLAFKDFEQNKIAKEMEKIVALALMESLHKRIAYLKGEKIVTLAEYIKKHKESAPAVLNAARRQNIPAFREKGVWKIGISALSKS
jgi:Fic family protein